MNAVKGEEHRMTGCNGYFSAAPQRVGGGMDELLMSSGLNTVKAYCTLEWIVLRVGVRRVETRHKILTSFPVSALCVHIH